MLAVSDAGLYATVQDRGRRGVGHLGVRYAGAADELALYAANILVGNEPDAAVLEMTLLGCTFEVRADCLIGIAGADMEVEVVEEKRALPVGRSHQLRAGTTVRCGGALDGARTYVALAGGIAAQKAFGSHATDPIAGFGGIDGRPLQPGDILAAPETGIRPERSWPLGLPSSGVVREPGPRTLRVVPGPHLEALPASVERLLGAAVWAVTPRSDRVGIRLEGSAVPDTGDLELVSVPMLPGAVQLPPNGQPIVLMPDAPTVGGYPVAAVLASVDRPISGQLRPGDEVTFEWVSLSEARALAAHRSAGFDALAGSDR